MNLMLDAAQVESEIERIVEFIRKQAGDSGKVIMGISGGLDSDLTLRLAVRALGGERIKIFVVQQRDMEPHHLRNANDLADNLGIPLQVFELADQPFLFIEKLAAGDPGEGFSPQSLLDPSRAKCSLRTMIFSAYQDRGYIVAGTSNRTETETGFFLPFGDGIWHMGPIVHLYKTQVRQLAEALGTGRQVVEQPASAGFWPGQSDLEDLSFWLCNRGPIGREKQFTDQEVALAEAILAELTTEKIDWALLAMSHGKNDQETAGLSGLSVDTVARLRDVKRAAAIFKLRPFGVRLDAPSSAPGMIR